MDLLVPDIIAEIIVLEPRHGERPISVLPSKVSAMGKILVDPSGGIRLDGAHQLRKG
jgi:hypothetical protein